MEPQSTGQIRVIAIAAGNDARFTERYIRELRVRFIQASGNGFRDPLRALMPLIAQNSRSGTAGRTHPDFTV